MPAPSVPTPAARPVRALLAASLALTVALVLLPAAGARAANSGQTDCLVGYNYADPASGYLFALTEGIDDPCAWVHVDINNPGQTTGSQFGGSRCFGTQLSYAQASWYVTTSTTTDPATWQTPCSNHYGAPSFGQRFNDWGALYFNVQ